LEIRRARAISSDPEFINLSAGQALANAGEWEMARLAFEKAIEINPAYGEAWAYLGAAENELGISGRESLNVAYSLDPDSLAVNLLMALHLQSNGDPQQALLHLNKARLSDPENPTLVAEMASIVASEGDISGALNLFDEAIRMAPEDALYWKIQSNFSIQNEVQIEEIGLPSARQATLLSPRDPEAFDLLGQAYFAVGNPLLAERFLIYAVSLDQEFASARYHLGVLYLTLGSVDQAREQLELVMAMAPETPLAEQASSLIRIYLQ
jgi:tetratricopeptide (TPR) repeat protein